jgi:oligopeptide transport system ATP-binding protein
VKKDHFKVPSIELPISEASREKIDARIEKQEPVASENAPVLCDLPILTVIGLKKHFPVRTGILPNAKGLIKAVDGVSFQIGKGKTLGIVGESGSGKSTVGNCVLCDMPVTEGKIVYRGKDLTSMGKRDLMNLRRELQSISQNPYLSLDPRMTIHETILEGPEIHRTVGSRKERFDLVAEMMEMVGLNPEFANRYPHELSGGQRQRVAIARALALKPAFIVCDEIVSALDVSIQAQIVGLMMKLQETLKLTYIFIGHDLSVIRHISNSVAVMYLGKAMEMTDSDALYGNPLHPYTQALISAAPIPNPTVDRARERIILEGDIPSPINPPKGCNFSTRCAHADKRCKEEEPELLDVGCGHFVACHRMEK